MYNKYRLVIFDLDGTLLNTLDDLADSVNYILSVFGYPPRTVSQVRSFVGDGIRKLLERAAPPQTEQTVIDSMFEQFKLYYAEHCADKTRPYEGVPGLLGELREKGYITAVVSNKADSAVGPLCEKYFPGLLSEAVGERAGVPRKPAPDSVNALIAGLGVPKEQAVYIGDSNIDIETARNAGIDCVTVAWGFRDEELLIQCGAEHIAHDADELRNYILC